MDGWGSGDEGGGGEGRGREGEFQRLSEEGVNSGDKHVKQVGVERPIDLLDRRRYNNMQLVR